VWWKFTGRLKNRPPATAETLLVGSRQVPLLLVRHARARRYLLRLRADGTARVTVPRGGTQAEARRFAERNHAWLEKQILRLQSRPRPPATWNLDSQIWFRGEQVGIEINAAGQIQFAGETLVMAGAGISLRPAIEKHLRQMAARELPPRVMEFAAQHRLTVRRVTVRNQKSRWGSCSRRGTLSLNWRLIQTPDSVRDYIIRHELAHLRHMNHSEKFWQEVERLDPGFRAAERWLKEHRDFLQ
jgi:predicted metal-dependent hydrolase